MKKYIAGGLAIAAIALTLPACGTGEDTATAADEATSTTTTEEPTEVGISTVEAAFASNLERRGERITEGKPNQMITTDKVDCTRTSEGKATCYVTMTYYVGSLEEQGHAAWDLRYDTEDGHPLAFEPR